MSARMKWPRAKPYNSSSSSPFYLLISIFCCRGLANRLASTEQALARVKDELAREKTAGNARLAQAALETRKAERECERLRGQVALYVKDPVITRMELTPTVPPALPTTPSTTHTSPNYSATTEALLAENSRLRDLVKTWMESLRNALHSAGVVSINTTLTAVTNVADPAMASAYPVVWAAEKWNAEARSLLASLLAWTEEIRETAGHCRALMPVLDSASQAGTYNCFEFNPK